MTPRESHSRLWLYVFIAFFSVIVPDWNTMVNATGHEWIGFLMKAGLQAAIALRAYIDKSPAEVSKAPVILPDGLPKSEPPTP